MACLVLTVSVAAVAGCGDSSADELEASQQRVAELEAELELQAAQQRVAELEEELQQAQESAAATTTAAPVTTTDAPTTTQAVDAEEECASNTSPGVPTQYWSNPVGWSFEKHLNDDLRVWEYQAFLNSIGAEIVNEVVTDPIFHADRTPWGVIARMLQPIVEEVEYRMTSAWCVIDTQEALDMLEAASDTIKNGMQSTGYEFWDLLLPDVEHFLEDVATDLRRERCNQPLRPGCDPIGL
jgi:hypothetical protein